MVKRHKKGGYEAASISSISFVFRTNCEPQHRLQMLYLGW